MAHQRVASPLRRLNSGPFDVVPTGRFVAVSNRNATESPLLRLPAEIRNLIFEYALSGHKIRPMFSTDSMTILGEHRLLPAEKKLLKHRFDLVRTCRQIYTETAVLPYSLSTFALFNLFRMEDWLETVCFTQKWLLRYITAIQCGMVIAGSVTESECDWIFSLKELCGLQRIEVHIRLVSSYCDFKHDKMFLETYFRNRGIEAVVQIGTSFERSLNEYLKF